MKLKQTIFLFTAVSISLCFSALVNAVSISPAKINETLEPGQSMEGSMIIGNTEAVPQFVNVEVKDYYINDGGGKVYIEENGPRGMKDWIIFEKTTSDKQIEPNQSFEFKFTIKVPEDATPGGYTTAIIGTSSEKVETTGAGMGVLARAVSLVSINVPGDYKENLEIEKFEINKTEFLKGNIVFSVILNNQGDANEAPIGDIKIYDATGAQVKEIYSVMKEAYGQEVVAEKRDEIPFNENYGLINAGTKKTYDLPWLNRQTPTGKYTAKLSMKYGKNNTNLEATTNFEIVENFNIAKLDVEASMKPELPIKFSTTIQNTGTTVLNPTGYFVVENIFGSQKFRVDFTPEELKLNGGQEKVLDNIEWADGFALGLYTGKLSLTVLNKVYTKSISFWIINWWQIVLIVVILVLVVYGLIKGIKSYKNLKRKLSKLEKKE